MGYPAEKMMKLTLIWQANGLKDFIYDCPCRNKVEAGIGVVTRYLVVCKISISVKVKVPSV